MAGIWGAVFSASPDACHSDEDFQTLWQASGEAENTARIVQIRRADNGVAENAFRRQLELDTHFLDEALFSISRAQSAQYTRLYPDTHGSRARMRMN